VSCLHSLVTSRLSILFCELFVKLGLRALGAALRGRLFFDLSFVVLRFFYTNCCRAILTRYVLLAQPCCHFSMNRCSTALPLNRRGGLLLLLRQK
jgi:hypothetical protein